MATKQTVYKIISMLSFFPNCPITKDNAQAINEMFYAALGDIPDEFLNAAYVQYISGDRPFFPTNPGTLREIAFDLELTANHVPTASQAWAMVIKGPTELRARWCETGALLRDTLLESNHENYGTSRSAYYAHIDACGICCPATRPGEYEHQIVTEAVRRMGGRDAILTDNVAADRARFLEAYREMVINERKILQMVPQVRAMLESKDRPSLIGGSVTALAAKLNSQR